MVSWIRRIAGGSDFTGPRDIISKAIRKAAESRRKSLELVQKERNKETSETPKKLLYYISAAMKHFLNDDKGALEDLQQALETKYAEKDTKLEALKNAEDGLNERIKDYVERIKASGKKPREMEADD